jgi:nitroreductase
MNSQTAELLADYAPAWFDAISTRHSRRTYDGSRASTEALDSLRGLSESFTPWEDARVQLLEQPDEDLFTGIIGSYGRITGAPHAALVIADTASPFSQAHAGYFGEAVVLQATHLGLQTCWIGGAFSASVARRHASLNPSEEILAAISIGHANEQYTSTDRSMRFFARAHRRKTSAQIAGTDHSAWPAWAREAVEAARLAPSAINRQPWRFSMDGDALVISQDRRDIGKKLTREMDCGIAMLHVELGAWKHGVTGDWQTIPGGGLSLRRFEPRDES